MPRHDMPFSNSVAYCGLETSPQHRDGSQYEALIQPTTRQDVLALPPALAEVRRPGRALCHQRLARSPGAGRGGVYVSECDAAMIGVGPRPFMHPERGTLALPFKTGTGIPSGHTRRYTSSRRPAPRTNTTAFHGRRHSPGLLGLSRHRRFPYRRRQILHR